MPKKQPQKNKPIEKPKFDLNGFKSDNSLMEDNIKDKELSFIPLSKAFYDATGLPGIPKGYITLFRGYTNTGKSTAAYEGVVGCQKLGILPVILDTENSWSWEHAKEIGVEFTEIADKETEEIVSYDGNFIYINNDILLRKYGKFDYKEAKEKKESRGEACIEDVARYVNELLDKQMNGDLPIELCFFWDSIGSLDCFQSITSNSRNNQWNAGAIESYFKSIVNYRIPSSRKEGKLYTNTFVGIQKIWLDNMAAGVVKHKGGESFFYAARLIIHLGGIQSHSTKKWFATSGTKQYCYGTEAAIKVEKNHVNGITWEGKIASTMHGYINPDERADYVNANRKFLLGKLEMEYGDFELKEEEVIDVDTEETGTGKKK